MLLIIQKQICPNVSCLPIPLYFCPSFCITQNNCYAVANPCRPNQLCRFTHGNTDIIAVICCKDGSFWHIIQSAAARIFLCILFGSSFIAIFCRRFWLLALSFFLLFLCLFFFLLLLLRFLLFLLLLLFLFLVFFLLFLVFFLLFLVLFLLFLVFLGVRIISVFPVLDGRLHGNFHLS